MDKDKSPAHGGGLPPPSGRYSGFLPTGTPFNVKPEPASSSLFPPLASGASADSGHFGHGMSAESSHFSHDISRMPDNPPRKLGHRRAHSEILTLPDDISFDSDLGVVGGADGPSFSDETEEDLFSMYLDMEKFNSSSATSSFQFGEPSSSAAAPVPALTPASRAPTSSAENIAIGSNERPRVRHQHSQSMDGSTSIKPEMLVSSSEDISAADSKKALSAAKLAELALIDPKRAKRYQFLSNHISCESTSNVCLICAYNKFDGTLSLHCINYEFICYFLGLPLLLHLISTCVLNSRSTIIIIFYHTLLYCLIVNC